MKPRPDDIPVEVFPLAQYLGEEMEERGWTSWDVGLRMGGETDEEVSKNAFVVELILSVLDGSLKWTPELYRQLERAFGVSDGFFERLNQPWLQHPDKRAGYDAPDHLYAGVYSVRSRP